MSEESLSKIGVDFIPSTYFVSCDAELTNYAKAELNNMTALLATWSLDAEDIRLMDSFFVRFKNQLRHFMFFKAFCSARRCIRQLCVGPQRKGISSFQTLVVGCDNEREFPGIPRIEHLLVCIYQCCRMMHVAFDRLTHCWRICDMQFSTGHFTKVLLLIMALLARFRTGLLCSYQGVISVYESLYAVRNRIPDSNIRFRVSLPPVIAPKIEDLFAIKQPTTRPTFASPREVPDTTVTNLLSVRDQLFDSLAVSKKQSKNQSKKIKRQLLHGHLAKSKQEQDKFNATDLSAVLASEKSTKQHGDLLSLLLKS